jgi:pimeloyl-ACP methyl ester carboxylesterase
MVLFLPEVAESVQQFTVCGHSSGGTMASNHFFAFSDRVLGLGQVESSGYAAGRTVQSDNISQMVAYARSSAKAGLIAPLTNVAQAPIWVMQGGNDTCASTLPATSVAFYRLLTANQSNVVFHLVQHAPSMAL